MNKMMKSAVIFASADSFSNKYITAHCKAAFAEESANTATTQVETTTTTNTRCTATNADSNQRSL